MEHVTHHRFVDLAEVAEDDASDKLRARRDFMRKIGIAAFASSATPAAFAQVVDRYNPDGPPQRYPKILGAAAVR